MLEIVLLIAGFILLIKGADIFVSASVGIAKKLKVPNVVIGLTIVAMGTSAPEVVISVTASLQGSNDLAVSNIVGSNIFNLIFIVGLFALIKSLDFNVRDVIKDFSLSIAAAVLLLIIAVTSRFVSYDTRIAAGIMLTIFIIYMILLVKQAMRNKTADDSAEQQKPLILSVVFAVIGCAMIIFGGQLTVDNAVKIAETIGITERVIGLTVIAIGTSLPELITFGVACKKKETGLAFGAIIGSNIFNILFILGLAGLISPLSFDSAMVFDMGFLIFGSLITLLFVYTGKRLGRREGAVMLALYLGYMAWVIV